MADLISSSANPLIRLIRRLQDRRHRQYQNSYFIEGIQPVWQAIEAGVRIETLLAAPDLLAGSPAERLVAEQEQRGTRVVRVTREVFLRLSDRDGPAGLGALVRGGRTAVLADLPVRPDPVFVALHDIGNPGNLGTIIRTANAAGAAGVILLGDCTDPYGPAAIKASMGALFSTPVAYERDPEVFFDWAAEHRITVATTSVRADGDHWDVTYPDRLVLLLGNEGRGLPEDLLRRGQLRVRIPMVGTAHSLNLSVAAGVLLYEVWRHRRSGS